MIFLQPPPPDLEKGKRHAPIFIRIDHGYCTLLHNVE